MTEDYYKPPKKGKHKLIVIEGLDGAGKTLQSKMLHMKLLQNFGAVLFEFPNYESITGRFIKQLLIENYVSYHSHAWACILAANRYEDRDYILNSMRHTNVVMNRYYQSNIVYSTVSGINTQWLVELDSRMPKPDLVIVIDIPVEESIRRKSNRDIIEQDISYLQKVRETYKTLGAPMGWRIIDGNRAPEEVHSDIIDIVNTEFGWKLE